MPHGMGRINGSMDRGSWTVDLYMDRLTRLENELVMRRVDFDFDAEDS